MKSPHSAEQTHIRNVLLVEDNPGDIRLTKEVFKDSPICKNLYYVPDGVEALAFLRQEGKFKLAPRPDIVLLDLNLPRMDGRELLAAIKQDDHLRTIPVVILTTSEASADIATAYRLHANCYLVKPVDYENFSHVVKNLETFWLETVRLPPTN